VEYWVLGRSGRNGRFRCGYDRTEDAEEGVGVPLIILIEWKCDGGNRTRSSAMFRIFHFSVLTQLAILHVVGSLLIASLSRISTGNECYSHGYQSMAEGYF
jgi:hypothetical protein